jgi:hypothetical protein
MPLQEQDQNSAHSPWPYDCLGVLSFRIHPNESYAFQSTLTERSPIHEEDNNAISEEPGTEWNEKAMKALVEISKAQKHRAHESREDRGNIFGLARR